MTDVTKLQQPRSDLEVAKELKDAIEHLAELMTAAHSQGVECVFNVNEEVSTKGRVTTKTYKPVIILRKILDT